MRFPTLHSEVCPNVTLRESFLNTHSKIAALSLCDSPYYCFTFLRNAHHHLVLHLFVYHRFPSDGRGFVFFT